MYINAHGIYFSLIFCFYIPPKLPLLPLISVPPPSLFPSIYSSSSVSLQMEAGLPWMSGSHCISSCSRHLLFY